MSTALTAQKRTEMTCLKAGHPLIFDCIKLSRRGNITILSDNYSVLKNFYLPKNKLKAEAKTIITLSKTLTNGIKKT